MTDTIEHVRVRVLPDGRVSRRDSATYLGRTPQTLANWVQEGRGPKAHRVGGRCFYYFDDLKSFVEGGAA